MSLAPASAGGWSESLRLLVDIARPRVIGLVVFTGLPALVLGKEIWPTAGDVRAYMGWADKGVIVKGEQPPHWGNRPRPTEE